MIDLILAIFATGGNLGGRELDLATPIMLDRGDLITPEYPKDPEQEKIRRKIKNLKKLRDFPYWRDRGPVMGTKELGFDEIPISPTFGNASFKLKKL